MLQEHPLSIIYLSNKLIQSLLVDILVICHPIHYRISLLLKMDNIQLLLKLVYGGKIFIVPILVSFVS